MARGIQAWSGRTAPDQTTEPALPNRRPPNPEKDQKAIASRSFRIETVPCEDPPIKKDEQKGADSPSGKSATMGCLTVPLQ